MTTYPTFSSPANCTPIETTHKTTQSKVVSKLVASKDFEVKCSYNRTIKVLKGGDIGGFSLCNDGAYAILDRYQCISSEKIPAEYVIEKWFVTVTETTKTVFEVAKPNI